MPFCPHCGFELKLGDEQFCPRCGYKLNNGQTGPSINSTNVTDTHCDAFGFGNSDFGTITGKEIRYTMNGPVINLQVTSSISQGVIDNLQKILSGPIQLELSSSLDNTTVKYDDNLKTKEEESSETHEQIKNILNDISKIEKDSNTDIQQIRAGDLQISKKDLSLKELALKGNEYYYKNEYKKAIECYDKALKQDPNNFDLLFSKAYSLGELAKYNEAIEYYDKALKKKPSSADTLNNKGWVLIDLSKYDEAIEYIDKALRIKPGHVHALNNKVVSLYNLGKYSEAISWYDKALKIKPDYADALNNKGISLRKLGKYYEAIGCYDEALKINPNNALVLNNKGTALYNLGKYTKAIRWYDKSLAIQPNYELALDNKLLAQEKLEKEDKDD